MKNTVIQIEEDVSSFFMESLINNINQLKDNKLNLTDLKILIAKAETIRKCVES